MDLSPGEVRRVLNGVLRTDADLEAFCIDALPEVAQRLSGAMDRVAKVNLILCLVRPMQIMDSLHARYPQETKRALVELTPSIGPARVGSSAAPDAQSYRAASQRRMMMRQSVPLRRPICTIEVKRTPTANLEVAYFIHFNDDLANEPEQVASDTPRRVAQIGATFSFEGLNGAMAINRILDLGQEHLLEQHLAGKAALEAGADLFKILFPSDHLWQTLMRRLTGAGATTAIVSPTQEWVRLRICTAEPDLLALPWRLLAWEGRFLVDHGWTVEVAPHVTATAKITLTVPAKLLVVAPRYRGMLDIGTDRHIAALTESLTRFSPQWGSSLLWRVAESRHGLRDALRGMRPDIVYYYGHGSQQAGGLPSLELGSPGDSPDYLLLSDLHRMLRECPPKVVFLNGCMTASAGCYGAGYQLVSDVPLVIAQRTTAYSGHAGAFALSWFQRCLIDGADPVDALHHLDDLYSRTDFQWCTSVLNTHYATFAVQVGHPAGPDSDAPRRLDRRDRKALVDEHVNALLRSQDHRVQAIVACAAPGNLIEEFSWQCVDYLIHEKGRQLLCLNMTFPSATGRLADMLDATLRHELQAADNEDLQYALRRKLPQGTRVIWMNWGTLHPPPGASLPLKRWLNYCCDRLVKHCPANCRVIAYLGLELDKAEHQDIAELLTAYQRELGTTGAHVHFRCDALSPLAAVTQNDLYHFFYEPHNSSCPVRLTRTAAELIYQRSRGVYVEAVELIKQGEASKWDDDFFRGQEVPRPGPVGKKKKRSYD